MSIRQEILDIPDALRTTLTEGRPAFEGLVRRTRLGDGPIFMVGSGSSYILGLTGVYAFEGLLGRPVVARPALDFRNYSAPALDARSLVLAVSQSGESTETIEAARAARSRGSTVLALTGSPTNSLAKIADGVLLVRSGEEDELRIKSVVCHQAALGYIAVLAARILKRPQPEVESLAEEFEKLPGQAEWVLTHLQDAARSLASGLRGLPRLCVVGLGSYYPAALQWALLLRKLTKIQVESLQPSEFGCGSLDRAGSDTGVVVISGSRCRPRKAIYQLVNQPRKIKAQLFSVTDVNDRELADQSSVAVLLPALSEIVGSTLALALLDWTAYEIGRP
jgi:glucosamine--fructose-6-phosphate aminotransferase (isomerizing)